MKILKIIKACMLSGAGPLWQIYLRLRGVECRGRLIAMGRPGIKKKTGSSIVLGRNVILCSSEIANPVARGGRCRLSTLSAGARLVLQDGVGLSSTLICCANSVEIGEGTIVGGDSMIFDTDFHPRTSDGVWLTDERAVSKPVKIGKRCFIGARSIILKGVTIGNNAVIGAGSVVTRDIPSGCIACGNPARVVKTVAAFQSHQTSL
jgi:acetyltransferase-like isoleucine patch superfamily enzyme